MTKQEMLAEVEAKIRKDIPRLLELREGCIIELDDIQAKMVLSNYEFENGCTHLLRNEERLWYATDEDLKHSKIIGHNIMLNDVFQWLFMNDNLHDVVHMFIDGTLIPKSGVIDYGLHVNFDSPYLKDQSEETIKFLYDLKQKIDE